RFVPVRFTPAASVFKSEECSGVNIVITDRATFRSVYTGIEIAFALHQIFPNQWKVDNYLRLLANGDALERLKRGESPEGIFQSWTTAVEAFRRRRAAALLY